MRRMQAVLVAALLLMGCLTGYAAAADVKLGYVDLQQALNNSQAGQEAKKRISKKAKEFEQQAAEKRQKLQALRQEIDKQGMMLSDEARSDKQRKLQNKVKDFKRFSQDAQEELKQEDQQYTQQIIEDLLRVVNRIGKERDFTMILEKSEGAVLYASEGVDLTADVVSAYDKAYEDGQNN